MQTRDFNSLYLGMQTVFLTGRCAAIEKPFFKGPVLQNAFASVNYLLVLQIHIKV
jgi:hypothetical protein